MNMPLRTWARAVAGSFRQRERESSVETTVPEYMPSVGVIAIGAGGGAGSTAAMGGGGGGGLAHAARTPAMNKQAASFKRM